jgi:hypothetical protein
MIATQPSTPELLQRSAIREILRSPGPCITILLPPYRPGEPAGSPATILRTNIREAAGHSAERKLPKSAGENLLQPLERLAEDAALASGSHWGRAIFRSPSVFEQFLLAQPAPASLSFGGSFAVRKLAVELELPRTFYILVLSKIRVSLLRCSGLEADVVKLPGVPDTLAEALALEPPDHDLENRSAAGSSAGAMHRVRFGTGSEREKDRAHLADYCKLVERGLQQLRGDADIPLILAGVEEDITIYRAASTYRNLIKKGIPGSPDVSREQPEILQQAYSLLRADCLERQASALIAAKERTSPSRFSTDPDAIVHAAFEGRVGQLYLNESANKIATFEREDYGSWGGEDVLNLAAVQTIIHSGKTSELPSEMMPEGSIAVGIMRF